MDKHAVSLSANYRHQIQELPWTVELDFGRIHISLGLNS
jgi:hypothetical protein